MIIVLALSLSAVGIAASWWSRREMRRAEESWKRATASWRAASAAWKQHPAARTFDLDDPEQKEAYRRFLNDGGYRL